MIKIQSPRNNIDQILVQFIVSCERVLTLCRLESAELTDDSGCRSILPERDQASEVGVRGVPFTGWRSGWFDCTPLIIDHQITQV